jgi:enoyl-CoA hydratase
MALVPEPALRLDKAITMLGIQASGLHAGLLVEGALGAMAHASHNEDREELFKTQRAEGMKAYLDQRDGPFQPEPMGPRSAKARAAKSSVKARKR